MAGHGGLLPERPDPGELYRPDPGAEVRAAPERRPARTCRHALRRHGAGHDAVRRCDGRPDRHRTGDPADPGGDAAGARGCWSARRSAVLRAGDRCPWCGARHPRRRDERPCRLGRAAERTADHEWLPRRLERQRRRRVVGRCRHGRPGRRARPALRWGRRCRRHRRTARRTPTDRCRRAGDRAARTGRLAYGLESHRHHARPDRVCPDAGRERRAGLEPALPARQPRRITGPGGHLDHRLHRVADHRPARWRPADHEVRAAPAVPDRRTDRRRRLCARRAESATVAGSAGLRHLRTRRLVPDAADLQRRRSRRRGRARRGGVRLAVHHVHLQRAAAGTGHHRVGGPAGRAGLDARRGSGVGRRGHRGFASVVRELLADQSAAHTHRAGPSRQGR